MRGSMLTKLGAGALAGLLLASAASAGELSFWTWRQEDKGQYQQLFQDFNKTSPDVRIGFEAFEPQSYQTVLSTALAAGKGPDVIHVRAYGGLEQFAKAGYLAALDPASTPELANFTPSALGSSSLRSDQRVYAIPFASQTLGILINTEVLEKANLKEAATWDDFLKLAKALKDKGVIPLANGTATAFMAEILTQTMTASFLGPDFPSEIAAGKATFEDPRYAAALQHLIELKDYFPPGFTGIDYPTSQQLFLSGRAAMLVGGSFEIANFRRQNPNLKIDFVAPPAPSATAPRLVSLFYDGGYAVNAKTGNREDALKLVRFMGTKGFGDRFSALLGNISPIKGVAIQDPLLAKVASLNQTSVPYITLVYFRYQDPTGSTLLQGAVQKMMAGQVTPADVGKELTAGIATYYEPFKKK
ncbi:MAG: extracellular solute-binding protein [Proteobacteria bacterium]|nr:extracellular solute-binding protein [Pseudomonadota bacterium]MBI3499499.1 extracellular solute-binding protein [Pseudomonadota bacterium]